MDIQSFVQKNVKHLYWEHDLNCATSNLLILSEKFDVKLSDQVVDSALGMHGAGEYGAQCGLVEGTLLFLGILGRQMGIPDNEIVIGCKEFAVTLKSSFQVCYALFYDQRVFLKKIRHIYAKV